MTHTLLDEIAMVALFITQSSFTRWVEVSLLHGAPLLHLHLNLLVCHGLAKDEGGEERSAKGKGDTHEGWRFLPPPFGLGPHFFWLIARESESEVCLFCDLL